MLRLVDHFTSATCHPGRPDVALLMKGDLVSEPFSCAIQSEKERCINGGGTCETIHDGYYIVNMICVIVGVITFFAYIRPKVLALQSLPLRAWRLSAGGK